jgi:DNA modification methylase
MNLIKGDCLEKLKNIPDNSIDLVFADLPYGQTSCKWDCKIDLKLLWKELKRVCKNKKKHGKATPLFFTTTTKFGVELIMSNRKWFRYDLIWVKSAPTGFLCARKMPMRKHEMVYVFYENLPFYDLSSHKHKFKKEMNNTVQIEDREDVKGLYGTETKKIQYRVNGKLREGEPRYDPKLPTSVLKASTATRECEEKKEETKTFVGATIPNKNMYGNVDIHFAQPSNDRTSVYNPPLPTSVLGNKILMKEDTAYIKEGRKYHQIVSQPSNYRKEVYNPPLPTSVLKEKTQISKPTKKELYGKTKGGTIGNIHGTNYNPPLPVSVLKDVYGYDDRKEVRTGKDIGKSSIYNPPLPTSILKEDEDKKEEWNPEYNCGKKLFVNTSGDNMYGYKNGYKYQPPNSKIRVPLYNPPLPTTILEIKSKKGKHRTQKPVDLMKWILKYYSKEGDTVLDPTMGSGSMGVACKQMNRKFIGIEKDEEIFKVAQQRIEEGK